MAAKMDAYWADVKADATAVRWVVRLVDVKAMRWGAWMDALMGETLADTKEG